jgi:hypothetical protein
MLPLHPKMRDEERRRFLSTYFEYDLFSARDSIMYENESYVYLEAKRNVLFLD